MPADTPPPPAHVISYAFESKGVFYHGTVSDLDGVPKSTWTISVGDKKNRFDQPIDYETFSFLWNGVADFEIFKRCAVTSGDRKMDFVQFQVIAIAYTVDWRKNARSFLVSPAETDPQYKTWIEKLHVPFEKSGQ
jgi:hypothetical protein